MKLLTTTLLKIRSGAMSLAVAAAIVGLVVPQDFASARSVRADASIREQDEQKVKKDKSDPCVKLERSANKKQDKKEKKELELECRRGIGGGVAKGAAYQTTRSAGMTRRAR